MKNQLFKLCGSLLAVALFIQLVGCGSSVSGVVTGDEASEVADAQKALASKTPEDERDPGN